MSTSASEWHCPQCGTNSHLRHKLDCTFESLNRRHMESMSMHCTCMAPPEDGNRVMPGCPIHDSLPAKHAPMIDNAVNRAIIAWRALTPAARFAVLDFMTARELKQRQPVIYYDQLTAALKVVAELLKLMEEP